MFIGSLALDLLPRDVHSLKAKHSQDVLDSCGRLLAGKPEAEVLSVRRQLFGSEDDKERTGRG
ncbi:MAG: hypothetical protein JWO12_2516 [Frankiales bacterium]|nr:hypothetical protein [Frankiales bacterium]